MLSLVKE